MKKIIIVLSALMVLALTACNFPFAAVTDDALATSVAKTVEAIEEKAPPLLPTMTMMPTNTPLPVATSTPMPTVTVAPTKEVIPCLFATFVSETITDKTEFSPGENFTKTWTLKNTGTCDWNTDYRLSFKSGDQMGAPDFVKISTETDPGENIAISVPMKAPATAGTYKGYWQMETHEGVKFGQVWVEIVVK